MKPKPLVSLNHFTFPVIRILCSLFLCSLGMRADPTLGSEARRILATAVLAVKCSMISALTLVVDVLRRIAASDSTRSPYRKGETFMSDPKTYDVAILGTGIGGGMLACILARQGFDVLLLEKEAHPRFAVGEALLPQSTMLMWMLGQRWDVPEILHLTRTESITEHVAPSCGVKRIIGFLYHRDGQRQDSSESHLLVPPVTPITSESHLFRQDIDLYLLNAALRYGVTYRDHTEATEVEFDPRGVDLTTSTGERFRARYVVDSSGYKSVLARKFSLREEPTHLRTQS